MRHHSADRGHSEALRRQFAGAGESAGEFFGATVPALTCALGIKLNGQLELTHGSARQKIAKKEPSVDIKNHNRAIRYRRLAIAEPDKCKAAYLRKLAEEAERGVLCTVDQMPSREVVERYESTGRL